MARVLLIEDDPDFAQLLQELLAGEGHQVRWLDTAEDALSLIDAEPFDLILLDNKMPRMSGLEFLEALQKRCVRIHVVLMTSAHRDQTVIQAMNLGAFAYVIKPDSVDDLLPEFLPVIREALEVRPAPPVQIQETPTEEPEEESTLIGRTPPMLRLLTQIGLAARHDLPMLLLGETGTGKELVAKALHSNSGRRHGPFVIMNCAGFAENLLDSEMFGHEVGAFTGAVKLRKGRFEHANGGTLFLDEVGDMPMPLQVKLLRVLENGEVTRMGNNDPIRVNVRVIAATHRDLDAMVREKTFREDLLYRLKGHTIHLPPLRERRGDIPLLARAFLARIFPNRSSRPRLHPEALNKLLGYTWPGNVRQLHKVVCRAAGTCRGALILPDDIDIGEPPPPVDSPRDPKADLHQALRHAAEAVWRQGHPEAWELLEDHLLRALLEVGLTRTAGNKSELARLLSISPNFLRKKLHQFGLIQPDVSE